MALHDSPRQHPGVFNAEQLGQGARTVGQVRQLLVVRGNVLPNHLVGAHGWVRTQCACMVRSGHRVAAVMDSVPQPCLCLGSKRSERAQLQGTQVKQRHVWG